MSDEILVNTCKGNVPLTEVTYQTMWHVSDKDTLFREVYWKNLEIVRDEVHNRSKPKTVPYGADREGALIYTSKGNIPIKGLDYEVAWEEDDENIILKDFYRLDGEIVKNSIHVYAKRGMNTQAEAQEFGQGQSSQRQF